MGFLTTLEPVGTPRERDRFSIDRVVGTDALHDNREIVFRVRMDRALETGRHTNERSVVAVLKVAVSRTRAKLALLGLYAGVDERNLVRGDAYRRSLMRDLPIRRG